MTGLIMKDLLCLRKTINLYIIFSAGFLALCVAVDFPMTTVASFLSVMVMVLPITTFTYDHAAKWEVYGLALPVSRTKTVAARYLLFVLLMGGIAVITAVFVVILLLMDRQDRAWELLLTLCGCLGVGALFNTFLLPLTYRFGVERAKIVLIGLVIVFAGLVTLWLVPLGGLDWLQSLDGPSVPEGSGTAPAGSIPAVLPWLVFGAAALCMVLLALSFLISCTVYRKKEM